MLVIFSGLPGTGKTTIARELARATGATYLRVDSIEQALREAGWAVEGEGYAVAHAIAGDNLRLGRTVIADCVNPWPLTRAAWREVADRAHVRALDVEIVCSDREEHRKRVESRVADIPNHVVPAWQDVLDRDYRPWDQDRLVIDTGRMTVDEAVMLIVRGIRSVRSVRL